MYKNNFNNDQVFSLISIIVIFSIFLVNFLNFIDVLFGTNTYGLSIWIKVLLMFILIINLRRLIKHLNYTILNIFGASLLVILINFSFFPENREYISEYALNFIFIILPVIVYLAGIKNYTYYFNSLLISSKIISIIILIFLFFSIFNISAIIMNSKYFMGLSYSLLIPVLVLYRDVLERKKIISIIQLFSLLSIIILFGSRGALLASVMYIIFETLINIRSNKFISTMFFIPIITAFLFYKQIADILYTILNGFGINNRTLFLLAYKLDHDSGRNELYTTIISDFIQSPMSIHGIGGERLLGKGYAHNIFLELFYQFGVILAFPFLFVILFYSLKTIFLFRNDNGILIRIFFFASVPPLMFSGSIWTSLSFWMWLILSIRLSSKYTAIKKQYPEGKT